MRDEHYTPFQGQQRPEPTPLEEILVFVMARCRGDKTDSMWGALRTSPHGCEAVYTLNGELHLKRLCPSEALARDHLATHQAELTVDGWILVAVQRSPTSG